MYKLGIDLGGTKIEGIILDISNNECFRLREKIDQQSDYETILSHIEHIYKMLEKNINGAPHSLGLGMPGSISPNNELLRFCNIVFMNEKPFLVDLEKLLKRKLAIENDANCFILAEQKLGAAKGYASAFGIILGTGCGGGYVVNDKLISGKNKIAGEWGHSVLKLNGQDCYCGRKGCIENFISGTALQKAYAKLSGMSKNVEDIIDLYRAGDKEASVAFENYLDYFGIAIANLITILDPDIIVLGGGVSNVKELYDEGIKRVSSQFSLEEIKPKIVKNTLGDSSGVLGAALIGI